MIHIDRVKFQNLLSFGPAGVDLELRDLNVLIGPNGSGKSNLLEVFALLKSLPVDMTRFMREAGGNSEWFYLGINNRAKSASIETQIKNPVSYPEGLIHKMEFSAVDSHFEIAEEIVSDAAPAPGESAIKTHFMSRQGRPPMRLRPIDPDFGVDQVDRQQSIVAQLRDPKRHPEITYLGHLYRSDIAIYRDWKFGRTAPARLPQKADLPSDHLEPDCGNLAMVLNSFAQNRKIKKQIIERMNDLMAGVEDFNVRIDGGTAQLFLHEGNFDSAVPASRLSDGTLRYFCLLAILLDPKPLGTVCIDEPELGLHPDIVGEVADLLIDASQRTQLIVTTHSSMLVEALNDRPEDVVVCQRSEAGSHMARLDKKQLKSWLKDYSLGQLWSRGFIGGNRW